MGAGAGIGFGGAAAFVSEGTAIAVFFAAAFFVAAFFAGIFFAAVFFTAFLAVVFLAAVFRAGFAAFGGDSAVGMSKRSSVVFLLIRESVGKRVCAVP
jgi:hypothetical protein